MMNYFFKCIASIEWHIKTNIVYSVMQSDGNIWKIDTYREAITSELMIAP